MVNGLRKRRRVSSACQGEKTGTSAYLFAVIAMMVLSPAMARADMATTARDWRDGGNIELFAPSSDVSMNREVLVADNRESTTSFRVFYEMENLSGKDQSLAVGFPVKIRRLVDSLPGAGPSQFLFAQRVKNATGYGYNDTLLALLTALAFVPPGEQPGPFLASHMQVSGDDEDVTLSLTAPNGAHLPIQRSWSMADLKKVASGTVTLPDALQKPILLGMETGEVTAPAMMGAILDSFAVRVADQAVPLGDMVLQVAEDGSVRMVFTFNLKLPARQKLRVQVVYSDPNEYYSYRSTTETQIFDLAPGSLWAGPIRELTVLDDANSVTLADKALPRMTGSASAQNLEPDGDLKWEWSRDNGDDRDQESVSDTVTPGSPPLRPYAGAAAISGLKASSTLPGTARYYESGETYVADYSAARAFDGIVGTSWVEGKPDDGVGEYLEFQLLHPARGIGVLPGIYLWDGLGELLMPQINRVESVYQKNNRPASLALLKKTGTQWNQVRTINLTDAPNKGRAEQPWTWVSDVLLEPGTYRLAIAGINKGTAYSDTCIAEVRFDTVFPDFWNLADPWYQWVLKALR